MYNDHHAVSPASPQAFPWGTMTGFVYNKKNNLLQFRLCYIQIQIQILEALNIYTVELNSISETPSVLLVFVFLRFGLNPFN